MNVFATAMDHIFANPSMAELLPVIEAVMVRKYNLQMEQSHGGETG